MEQTLIWVWILSPFGLLPLFLYFFIHYIKIKRRFASVISVEDEAKRIQKGLNKASKELSELRTSYSQKREILSSLETQVAVYEESLAFAELGVYEPHFDYGDSEEYKQSIKKIRELQKRMVSDKTATFYPNGWTVDGSRSKGQAMINRQIRLTLRAFNNECEAGIANARWNNVVAMEKRILNAAKQINSANNSMDLVINEDYVSLKLDELYLTHEYREQLKIEKDERAELTRAAREEKRLIAEAEASEREERKYQTLLEKARKEVSVDEAKIAELEAALEAAHTNTERARSMAELTKSGYVYVISNIGSFGENVVKIGLTRRLDPNDRIKELGDASVPFAFDTHAMIYSEDAPALEKALHNEFAVKRINAANTRKEFFATNLDEVESAVRNLMPDAQFFKDREAQEWHETLALRKQALSDMAKKSDEFPDAI
ncbi:MAG: DUF4041 domain-containing protein [Hyphomicrobiales bacterium]